MSNKLVVKCGNFAVLVDLHVLPQGTSKDTSWFSDYEKEEVCTLLKQTIDSRVRQHIESRREQGQVKPKEYTQANPLFLKGKRLQIAAYFIKRWVNLRCVMNHHYRELYVFPDRCVVCVSQCDPGSNMCDAELVKLASKKEISSGMSEYFAGHGESDAATTLRMQTVLRNIVKNTKASNDANSGSGGSLKECPSFGLAVSDTGNKSTPLSELEFRNMEPTKHYINTPHHNSLEFPDSEVENYVNHRQPCSSSSQHKPRSAEWLQERDPTKALSWICESAQPEEKQTLPTSIMQQKRRRHSSEGMTAVSCKKLNLRDDTFIGQTDYGRGAIEDIPLALRIGNWQKPTKSTSGTTMFTEKASLAVEAEALTSLEKRSTMANETSNEQGGEYDKKIVNGPPKKLKLQRIKK